MGIRVVPRIAEEFKLKAAKIVAAKERKANKDEKSKNIKAEVKDKFDEMAVGQKMLQSKLDFKPKREATKVSKGNPWSDGQSTILCKVYRRQDLNILNGPRRSVFFTFKTAM